MLKRCPVPESPMKGVSPKSGALWLLIIASLLLGASSITLMRVRGVIEDFSESSAKAEVQQIVEKFAIIQLILVQVEHVL